MKTQIQWILNVILFVSFATAAVATELTKDDLRVLPPGAGYDMFWDYMHAQAAALPHRPFPPASTAEWDARRLDVRRELADVLGISGLEKTPLNARAGQSFPGPS